MSDLPEPWRQYAYADKTELVSIATMNAFRPYNRLGKTDLDALVEDIRRHGFREPLIVTYYAGSRTAVLGEGTHRLAAANRLGLISVPVRVTRSESEGPAFATPVPGKTPNEDGYTPGDMRPSEIGLA